MVLVVSLFEAVKGDRQSLESGLVVFTLYMLRSSVVEGDCLLEGIGVAVRHGVKLLAIIGNDNIIVVGIMLMRRSKDCELL